MVTSARVERIKCIFTALEGRIDKQVIAVIIIAINAGGPIPTSKAYIQ